MRRGRTGRRVSGSGPQAESVLESVTSPVWGRSARSAGWGPAFFVFACEWIDAQTCVWYALCMLGEGGTPLSRLQAAVREFQAREARRVDPKGLRGVIDALEGEFAAGVREAERSGDHLISGNMGPAATWIGLSC